MKYVRALFQIIFWTFVICVLAGGVLGYKFYQKFEVYKAEVVKQSGVETFKYSPSETTKIYTSDGVLLAKLYDENRDYVTVAHMPDNLKKAFVAIEDKNFYRHQGVDIQGIMRAVVVDITTGKMHGGSTITQQFVKNEFLTKEQTFTRKIKEAIISHELEMRFSKDEILEMYLNEISFGYQVYGVQAASKTFFGKDVSQLTLSESALLAGMVQGTSIYNPVRNKDRAIERRNVVLAVMKNNGIIDKQQYEEAVKQNITIVSSQSGSKVTNYKYPYYTSFIVKELEKEYGKEIYSNGFIVYTTLDSSMQDIAEKAVQENVDAKGKSQNFSNAALVSIENGTGQVKAFVGGYSFDKDQNNMAITPRQPGSSIKPFTYATGIDKKVFGITSLFKDEPVSFGGYSPQNYSGGHKGYMTVLQAIMQSNNVVAVKAIKEVGVNNVVSNLKKLGVSSITENDYNLSLTLGGLSYGISPYELAGAYSAFPNGGQMNKKQNILFIKGKNGAIVKKYAKETSEVFSKDTADKINYALYNNVQSGTGTHASIGKPVAGKTGTTNNMLAVWFAGYTPDLTTTVWVGNSDNAPMKGVTGGGTAAPIFAKFMKEATKQYGSRGFDVSYALKSVEIDTETGQLKGEFCPPTSVQTFSMVESDIPKVTCELHASATTKTMYDKNGKEYVIHYDKNGNAFDMPKDSLGNIIPLLDKKPEVTTPVQPTPTPTSGESTGGTEKPPVVDTNPPTTVPTTPSEGEKPVETVPVPSGTGQTQNQSVSP